MAAPNKKITYTSEHKLKILEYYLRNGGESKYGLKVKTCTLFNVNKKLINRLLENPEMMKKAKRNIARNAKTGSKGAAAKVVKSGAKTIGKPVVKPKVVVGGKSSTSVTNKGSSSNVAPSSHGTTGNNKQKVSGLGSSSSSNNINNNSNTTTTTGKTSMQRNFSPQKNDAEKENATLFDLLPENPDFSILKRPITSSSSSNASSIARLLVTGTNEVQNMLLNECEIIFECKVCRNLFRSIVNFLAHKRIYCRDNYTEVKNIFHKDPQCGLTTQSSTVVVEPEPPPESAAQKETWATSDNFSWRSRHRRRRIDNIADTLARKNDKKVETSPTSSSHDGSSQYHQRISSVSSERDLITRECTVTLENIAGVRNAVYQTYTPPDADPSPADYEATHAKIQKQQKGQTVEVTKSGKVVPMDLEKVEALEAKTPPEPPAKVSSPIKQHLCGQCNQQFATAKTLGVHQRSVHNNERTIFPCPMCETSFLSMWAAVKHLHKYHGKSKAQRERLRKVIKKKSYKKILTLAEEGAVKKAAEDMEKEQEKEAEEEEEEAKSTDSDTPNFKMSPEKSQNESQDTDLTNDVQQEEQQGDDDDDNDDNGGDEDGDEHDNNRNMDKDDDVLDQKEVVKEQPPERSSPLKGSCRSKRGVRWMCNVCSKKFLSRSTCLAHVATHITCNFEPMAVEVPGPPEERHNVLALTKFEEPPRLKRKSVESEKHFRNSSEKQFERNVSKLEESGKRKKKTVESGIQFRSSSEKQFERNLGINPKRKIIDSEIKLKYRNADNKRKEKNMDFKEHKYESHNYEEKNIEKNKEKYLKTHPYQEEKKENKNSIQVTPTASTSSNIQKVKSFTLQGESGMAAQTTIMAARKVLAKAKNTAAKASISPRNAHDIVKSSNKRNIEKDRFINLTKNFNISSGLKRKNETDITGEKSMRVEANEFLPSVSNKNKIGSTINIDSIVPINTSRVKHKPSILKDRTSRMKGLHFVGQITSVSGKKLTTITPVSSVTQISSDSKSWKEIEDPEHFSEIPLKTEASYSPHSEESESRTSLPESHFKDSKPSSSSTPQKKVAETNFEKDIKINDDPFDGIPSTSFEEINSLLIKEEDIKTENSEEHEFEKREDVQQDIIKYEHVVSPEPTNTNPADIGSKENLPTEHRYIQYKSNKLIKGPIDKVGSCISYQSIFRKTKKPVFNKSSDEFTDEDLPLSEKTSREEDDSTMSDSTSATDLESDENFFTKALKTKDISQNTCSESKIGASNLSTFEDKIKSKESFLKSVEHFNMCDSKSSESSNIELQNQSSSEISIVQNSTNDSSPLRKSLHLSNTLFGKLSYDFQSDYNECTLSNTNEDSDSNVSDSSTLETQEEQKSFMKHLNETSSEVNTKNQLEDVRFEDEIFGDILQHEKEKNPECE